MVAVGNGLHSGPTRRVQGEARRQDRAEKAQALRPGVLASSPDSDTHSCVILSPSLNLSEPQILCLIWELWRTILPDRAVV